MQQAQAEGLTLLESDNKTGYLGVHNNDLHKARPYEARVCVRGQRVSLGYTATAEEGALWLARSKQAPAPATVQAGKRGLQQARPEGSRLLEAESSSGPLGPQARRRRLSAPGVGGLPTCIVLDAVEVGDEAALEDEAAVAVDAAADELSLESRDHLTAFCRGLALARGRVYLSVCL